MRRPPISAKVLYRVNVTVARCPKKDVENALAQLEEAGWTIAIASSGHRWGLAKCGESSRAGCQMSIWSTPATQVNTLDSSCISCSGAPTNRPRRVADLPVFTFTLIVEGPDIQAAEIVDALQEAGCDDALAGRSNGVQYLDFDRKAESVGEAVTSAVADVESVEGLSVARIAGAGLVSMADIAARTGRTRESVRLLVSGERGSGGFPPPATDPRSRYRLWRADEVEHWMRDYLGESAEWQEDVLLAALNVGLEFRHHWAFLSDTDRAELRTLIDL